MDPAEAQPWTFFAALVAAYVVACAAWLIIFTPPSRRLWPNDSRPRTDHPWLDLGLVLVAIAGILGTGTLYRQGWLLPRFDGWVGDLMWQLDNLIIYAPIALLLLARRQSIRTVYLSPAGLPVKLATGLVLGGIAVTAYGLVRGEPTLIAPVARASVRLENARNFLPVFLEGVAIAYAFVRFQWAVGRWPALIAPGLLFAAAHIPRQLESGLDGSAMAAYFAVTAGVTLVVLLTLKRSRDVVWLGIVHYLMDIAINAFA